MQSTLSTQEQILIEQRLSNERKSTGLAYLLWIFTGGVGGHRFYLGKPGTALLQFALTIIGFAAPPMFMALGLWLLVDLFLIPALIREDNDRKRTSLAGQVRPQQAS
jgi:TM2 domain-containing membrane protein YozV